MRILIGVQFLFAKSLIYKAFSILFNDIRLCGAPKSVTAEPFAFSPITPFNERLRGVHFRQKGCAHFNYSSRVKNPLLLQKEFTKCRTTIHLGQLNKKGMRNRASCVKVELSHKTF